MIKDLIGGISVGENGTIICIESYFKQEPTRLMVETLEVSVVWELPRVEVGEIDRSSRYRTSLSRFYRTFFDRVTGEGGHACFEPAHERYNRLLQLLSRNIEACASCVHRFLYYR